MATTSLAASTSSADTQAGSGGPRGAGADEKGPGGARGGGVFDDRLGDREDVGLVERSVERRAAVTRRAERHLLGDVVGIRLDRVIRGNQMGQIDKVFGQGPVDRPGGEPCLPILPLLHSTVALC